MVDLVGVVRNACFIINCLFRISFDDYRHYR